MNETTAVMIISNRKEKRVVLLNRDDVYEQGMAFIASKKWKRVHVYLLSESDGPGRGVSGTMTITPPKRIPATTAAPGAADSNQVHEEKR